VELLALPPPLGLEASKPFSAAQDGEECVGEKISVPSGVSGSLDDDDGDNEPHPESESIEVRATDWQIR
jgi:hypothetical protein